MTKVIEKTIRITHEDIVLGDRYDHCRCAVACALRKVFPRTGIYVDGSLIKLYGTTGVVTMTTPKHIASFISDYDDGKEVSEVSFDFKGDLVPYEY